MKKEHSNKAGHIYTENPIGTKVTTTKHIVELLVKERLYELDAEGEIFDEMFRLRDFTDLEADFLDREKKRLVKLKEKKRIYEEWLNE